MFCGGFLYVFAGFSFVVVDGFSKVFVVFFCACWWKPKTKNIFVVGDSLSEKGLEKNESTIQLSVFTLNSALFVGRSLRKTKGSKGN